MPRYHPTDTSNRLRMLENLIGKGEVLRKLGRAAWESIPKVRIVKRGKRQYVRFVDYDRLAQAQAVENAVSIWT
jgi:hypothetical protein